MNSWHRVDTWVGVINSGNKDDKQRTYTGVINSVVGENEVGDDR